MVYHPDKNRKDSASSDIFNQVSVADEVSVAGDYVDTMMRKRAVVMAPFSTAKRATGKEAFTPSLLP